MNAVKKPLKKISKKVAGTKDKRAAMKKTHVKAHGVKNLITSKPPKPAAPAAIAKKVPSAARSHSKQPIVKQIPSKPKDKRTVRSLLGAENIFVTVPGTRSDALRVLGKYNVSGVPVVQKKTGKLAGVVTRTDILRKPEEEQLALLMTSTPIIIKAEDPVEKAAKIFYEKKIRCLPVVDGKGVLLGTIRPMDVLNAYAGGIGTRVGDCLAGYTVPVYQDTPLPVVMAILNITKATALPVLDNNGKLSGIVADGDLFKLSSEEEKTVMSRFGIAGDEDKWSWEGTRDAMLLYHQTTKTKLPAVPVKEVMVKDPVSVFKDALVKIAIWKMRKFNFNQLPVVDEQNNLVGIVSDLDLMGALVK